MAHFRTIDYIKDTCRIYALYTYYLYADVYVYMNIGIVHEKRINLRIIICNNRYHCLNINSYLIYFINY